MYLIRRRADGLYHMVLVVLVDHVPVLDIGERTNVI